LPPEQTKRRPSLSRKSRRRDSVSSTSSGDSSDNEVFAAAAAAQAAASETPSRASRTSQEFKTPASPSRQAPSIIVSTPSYSSPYRPKSTAAELRDMKQTLQEREKQLNRVSQRSRDMNDSAANFAMAAQGFLDLSQKKKR